MAVYLLGAPVVHAAHERWQQTFTSVGLRVGTPLLAALLGMAITSGGDQGDVWSGLGGAVVGIGVGAIGAQVLEAAFLAGPDDDPDGMPRARMVTFGGAF